MLNKLADTRENSCARRPEGQECNVSTDLYTDVVCLSGSLGSAQPSPMRTVPCDCSTMVRPRPECVDIRACTMHCALRMCMHVIGQFYVPLLEPAASTKQIERVDAVHNNLAPIEVPRNFLSAMSPPPFYVRNASATGTAVSMEPLQLKVEKSAAVLPSMAIRTAKKVAKKVTEKQAEAVQKFAKAEKVAEDNVTKMQQALPAKSSKAWHQEVSFRTLILCGIAAAASIACAALAPPSAPGINPVVTKISATPVHELHDVTAIEQTWICLVSTYESHLT